MAKKQKTYIRSTDAGFQMVCVEGCERCKIDDYIRHFNCMYAGLRTGHSDSHCTANACY